VDGRKGKYQHPRNMSVINMFACAQQFGTHLCSRSFRMIRLFTRSRTYAGQVRRVFMATANPGRQCIPLFHLAREGEMRMGCRGENVFPVASWHPAA